MKIEEIIPERVDRNFIHWGDFITRHQIEARANPAGLPEVPSDQLLRGLPQAAAAHARLEQPAQSPPGRLAHSGQPQLPRHRGPAGHRQLRRLPRPGRRLQLRELPSGRWPRRQSPPGELHREASALGHQPQPHVPDMSPLGRRTAWAVAARGAPRRWRPATRGDRRTWARRSADDSYTQGVGPVLQTRCASCHGATMAEADYRVDSYQAAIARRPDGTIRVKAGDDSSPLLQAARGQLPGPHTAIPQNEITELQTWVVECALKPQPYTVHINGWMDPGNSDQFHGRVLRQAVYDLQGCQDCHGPNLTGGVANVSCLSCHASGVMACNTCHGSDGERRASAEPRLPLRDHAGDGGGAPVTRDGRTVAHRLPLPGVPHHADPARGRGPLPVRWQAPPRAGAGHRPQRGAGPVLLGSLERHLLQQLLPRPVPGRERHADQPGVDAGGAGPGSLRQLSRHSAGRPRPGYAVQDLSPPDLRGRDSRARRSTPTGSRPGRAGGQLHRLPRQRRQPGAADRSPRPLGPELPDRGGPPRPPRAHCTRSLRRWRAPSATWCRHELYSPGHIDHRPAGGGLPGRMRAHWPGRTAPRCPTTRPPRPAPRTATGRARACRPTPLRAINRTPTFNGGPRPGRLRDLSRDSAAAAGHLVPRRRDQHHPVLGLPSEDRHPAPGTSSSTRTAARST